MDGASPDAASSLVILVPAAGKVADHERRRLDRTRAWTVPAHITLLYPFAGLGSVSAGTLARIEHVCRHHAAFTFQLAETGWFGDRVMYLKPDPAEPFVSLCAALAAEFPEHPPYAGAYQETVPHLTVGEGRRPGRMRRSARRLERRLPIEADATEVSLIAPGDGGRWDVEYRFPLEASSA